MNEAIALKNFSLAEASYLMISALVKNTRYAIATKTKRDHFYLGFTKNMAPKKG